VIVIFILVICSSYCVFVAVVPEVELDAVFAVVVEFVSMLGHYFCYFISWNLLVYFSHFLDSVTRLLITPSQRSADDPMPE